MTAVKDGTIYVYFGCLNFGKDVPAEQMLSKTVYRLEENGWKQLPEIPYVGKYEDQSDIKVPCMQGTCVAVGNGLLFINCSADGGGNVFLYDDQGNCRSLNYTINDYVNDFKIKQSAAVTSEGVYYAQEISDGYRDGYALYFLPKDSLN